MFASKHLVAESLHGPEPCPRSADSRSTTFIKGLAARELALETAGFLVSRESGARAIRSPRPCLCLVRLVAEIFDICFFVCRYAGSPCPADCSSVAHRDDKILGVLPDGSRLKYELLPYRVISLAIAAYGLHRLIGCSSAVSKDGLIRDHVDSTEAGAGPVRLRVVCLDTPPVNLPGGLCMAGDFSPTICYGT